MRTICACGVYEVEQPASTYRKGDKPMCAEWTCQKVQANRDAVRISCPNRIEHESPDLENERWRDDDADRVAEPYGRSTFARFTDI